MHESVYPSPVTAATQADARRCNAAYLDHAATTPIRPAALAALATNAAVVGNPSSLHTSGRLSRRLVEEARESVAADLGVRPNDVVFTSGGTEADNLAIKGLYWASQGDDPLRRLLVVSPTEHHAVLDAVEWLVDQQGAQVVWIPVDSHGRVDVVWLSEFVAKHQASIALICVMWANNETGTIQPIAEVALLAQAHGIPLHCDAVQAAPWLAGPGSWLVGPSAVAVSGHKFGAPVGVGALVLNAATPQPLTHGGGQEIDVRSGTVATALITSFAAALAEATATRTQTSARVSALTQSLRDQVLAAVPDAVVQAATGAALPSISSVAFPGAKSDSLLMLLDAAGVACSAGSACTAGVPRPSHVLAAMGVGEDQSTSSLRFSLGWDSTQDDVDVLVAALPGAVQRSRNATSRSRRAAAAVQVSQ